MRMRVRARARTNPGQGSDAIGYPGARLAQHVNGRQVGAGMNHQSGASSV